MTGQRIQVNDSMQSGYSYTLSEPSGENFSPDFEPELTPKEMLELGVFGGKYMTDCQDEFPADWFQTRSLVRSTLTRTSTASVSLRRSRSRSGAAKAGSGTTIRAAGFNGTADTISVAGATTMNDRLSAGAPCADTSHRSKRTVRDTSWTAVRNNGRRYCTGLTTREISSLSHQRVYAFSQPHELLACS